MAGLRALSDFVRTAAGAGINAASYVVTRLVDDVSIASGVTAADADPLTDLDGFFDEDETTIAYNGPLKYVVTTSTGTRTHTSKSTGVVGAWRTLDVTRVWRLHGKGVVPGVLSDLAVTTSGSNMVVTVAAGEYLAAIADHGLIYSWPANRTLTATTADATNPRIDTVVLRFYPPGVVEEGRIDLVLRAGTAAASPVAVTLHQSTDYWEEALADVRVDATVTSLAANKVTDRRAYLMLLPSTMTAGDTFYVDANGKLAQLAKGTSGQYLRQGATIPAWDTIDNADLPATIDATKIADGTVTNAEFQFIGTVTSDVQTQLNAKAPLAAPVFTGQPTIADFTLMAHDHGDADDGGAVVVGALPSAIPATKIGAGAVSDAEFGYLDGVTSAIQAQLDARQPLDADLTTIAGLTATTNNFLVAVASAWASRTPTQAKTTLSLDNVDNTSDATKNAASVTLTNKTIASPTVTGTATLVDATVSGTLTANGNVNLGDATADVLTFTGHLEWAGSAPSVAANAGAGTGGTATVAWGNDTRGVVEVVTGTGMSAVNLFTLTFFAARPDDKYVVVIQPMGDNSAALTLKPFANESTFTTTAFTVKAPVALTASTTYRFSYMILG